MGAAAHLVAEAARIIEARCPLVLGEMRRKVREHKIYGELFQFPERPSAGPFLDVHQIGLRLAGYPLRFKDSRRVVANAKLTLCALHVDSGDAPRAFGSPLVYGCLREEGVRCDARRPMRSSDLVVFEAPKGGRCVRIQTASLHHLCVVIFSSDRRLHCNVWPDSLEADVTPGLALLRMVPYSLKEIDDFGTAIEEEPALMAEVEAKLGPELLDRWRRIKGRGK